MLLRRNTVLLGAVLFVLLSASLILWVKAEAAMWVQSYGEDYLEEAFSLVATSDGGYAIAGLTTSFAAGGTDFGVNGDFWLVKTDEDGAAPVEPEAPWVVLPFLLAATVSIFICKKKLLFKRS
jgi:hypothetical protein